MSSVTAEQVRAYVEGPGEAWTEQIERTGEVPAALWDELREHGFLSLAAPAELGGRGLPFTEYLPLLERFAHPHGSLRMIVHVCNGIWRPIAAHANDEQRERLLRPLVAGELKVAFALTEPGAGTGTDLRCTLAREGEHYYVTGEKHLITFGTIADYLLLIARLEGTTGAEGITAVMVPPRGEGVQAHVMPESMGLRGTDHAHLAFDRAPVPVANRLGEEGQGLEIAIGGFLAPSRIALAMTCVGLAQRALDLAVDHAKRRETFGRKLAERQAIAFMLAEMGTEIAAARALVLSAARTFEGGEPAVHEASMAKLFASEMLQRVTDAALRVHGGIGYFSPSPIERVYRDARAQIFEEGTAEIQKLTIARGALALMRYVELDIGSINLRDGPEPEPPPGFGRVRVHACGVCGTDLHLFRGMVLPRGASYPVRPGHEVAGIVEEINGPDTHLSVGDLAVLHPLAPCGRCAGCRAGDDQRCDSVRALGVHDPGGFAEVVTWPLSRMRAANGLTPAAAALLADAAATAHHALRLARVPVGGSLCVLGAGGLGTGVLAVARALDPTVRLAAVVRSEATAARVKAYGVEVHRGLDHAAHDLRRRIGRLDAVVDFSGDAAAPAVGAAMLRRGGRLVLGSVVDAPLMLGPSSAFMAHELEVLGAYVSTIDDLAAVIDLACAGRLDPERWVSHRRPLEQFEEALALAEIRPPGTVRVVVECG